MRRGTDLFGLYWDSGVSPVLVAMLVAAIALALIAVRQVRLTRTGRDPLMDTALFRIPSFRGGNIATVIIGVGEFGVIAVLPLWLQFTLGYTSLQAGVALLPLAVGSFLASGISFGLAPKLGALGLVRVGLGLEAVALAALGLVARVDSPWWAVAPPLLVYGVGVGFVTAQVTNVVLADVPETSAGQGSGIQSTFRQLGSAIGIAVLTTVFYSVLGAHVSARLQDAGLPHSAAARIADAVTVSAGAIIASLAAHPATASAALAAREGMTLGVTVTALVAAGALVLGVVATALIRGRRGGSAGEPAVGAAPSAADGRAVDAAH